MQCEWDAYKTGDLVQTTVELVVRKDGFTFDQSDCDAEGKIPRDWLTGGDLLPAGVLCSFIRLGEDDPEYALVKRDLVGRTLVIRTAYLNRVSSIDDAVEVEIEGSSEDSI